jgi:putative hydrolase of the HAD superfamily
MDTGATGLKLEVRPEVRTRSPRELLIFSLDDTLIDTSLYWLAREAYARAVKAKGAESQSAGGLPTREWEGGRIYECVAEHGAVTMQDAWQAFQKECELPQQGDMTLYGMMTRSLRQKYPAMNGGAEDLLKWAQARFTVALLTCGNVEVQKGKIEEAKLGGFFKEIKVVAENGPEVIQGLIAGLGFSPRNTWVIGGSVRADINPGIAAGTHCILYTPPKLNGTQEEGEEPSGPVFRIHDLEDARAILAKPTTCVAA